MDSPTGVIPEEFMYPQYKHEVINFLISQPLPSWRKVSLLQGWCVCVGVRCRSIEYHLLEVSGHDNTIPLGA